MSGGFGNRAGDNAGGTDDAKFATVGGGELNFATGESATVGGGDNNSANANEATIAGGGTNEANGTASSIGGGTNNITNSFWSTISGGDGNTASGEAAYIGAGKSNNASGNSSAIGGGDSNQTLGINSFIGGGGTNQTTGQYSVVAGGQNNKSTAQFHSAVLGGSGTPLAGVRLSPGGGAWTTLSDRNSKKNFSPIEAKKILEKLNSIPIETWSYKTQDNAIRHIGPMAQDFKKAFGVGEDEHYINTVDANGVALSAIQGLYQQLLEQDQLIKKMTKENSQQQTVINDMQKRIDRIEQFVLNNSINPKKRLTANSK